jgi:tetratricopeptide (TPR) repeat protein
MPWQRFVSWVITITLTSLACAGPGSMPAEDALANDARGSGPAQDHAHPHAPRRVVPDGAGAPLFTDLGDFHRGITTDSELAQRYFDQGLILAYGFNHAEALRAFKEASAQDPGCAMCAWGEAYVLGPNINKPMDPADAPAAHAAALRAVKLAPAATAVEQALIAALTERYAPSPTSDRAALDRAYANAMRDVAAGFPKDPDVQTLFAEAVMDTMPWDYYVDPETPKPATVEALAALEAVIARDPRHPGALHFYIHAIEPSSRPERAEAAADRLGPLSPGAGHLVHMPSHIYLRVGRYHDASVANEKAAAADESYITQCRAQGFYPAAYYPHNIHFLYASAAFEGRSAVSIEAARKLSANITPEIVDAVPSAEEFAPMRIYALARFGRWDDLLAIPAPIPSWRYTTGAWRYGRGMALASTGDRAGARNELAALQGLATDPALATTVFTSGASPAALLEIGAHVLEARIAGISGDWDAAIRLLSEAVERQDALPYTEPPPWYFPNREALGAALLAAGRAQQAEAVFIEQLEHTPRNGWSLRGLAASQRAQGHTQQALATEAQLAEVWSRADISPEAAVY